MSNLRRQSQSRSSSNPPRRGSQARASTLGRMTRTRTRFPGQPRTLLPSRGRTSLFPANMDVEMVGLSYYMFCLAFDFGQSVEFSLICSA